MRARWDLSTHPSQSCQLAQEGRTGLTLPSSTPEMSMYNQAELRSAQIPTKARQGFVWFSEIGSHQANGLELIKTKLPLTQRSTCLRPLGLKMCTTMPIFLF